MIQDTAAIVVVKEGNILLVKRLNEPNRGWWCIPGGHVDEGEAVEEAAAREASEEVPGVTVSGKPFFIFEHDVDAGEAGSPGKHRHLCHTFFGKADGAIKAGSDAGEFRWFSFEDALKERIIPATRTIIEWLKKNTERI